jgi:hypothetical protein
MAKSGETEGKVVIAEKEVAVNVICRYLDNSMVVIDP